MESNKIDFRTTLIDSISIGLKNAPSIVTAVALWVVTIWVPYINLGTTIAITLLPAQLAKGEIINPFDIFDSKYRRYMGEYLITSALISIGTLISACFMLIPAFVLSIAWSQSFYFLIEKGKNPIQGIQASNDATYGSKKAIFLVMLVIAIAIGIVGGILNAICDAINVGFITFIVMLVVVVVGASVLLATRASIWRQLKDNVD